jgi:predicted nucleic acid-binding Zn ribbon protein
MTDFEPLPPKFCDHCGDPIPPGPRVVCDDCRLDGIAEREDADD